MRRQSAKTRPKGKLCLGIDLGATKVLIALVDQRGKIWSEQRLSTREILAQEPNLRRQPRAFATALASAILELKPSSEIHSWGLASAGPLDVSRRELLSPANLPGWGRVPIAALIEDALARELRSQSHRSDTPTQAFTRLLKTPLAFQNDAVAAAIAEARVGLAQRTETSMTLTLGTGLGTGVILNGKPAQSRGLGCEWGHLVVDCLGPDSTAHRRTAVQLTERERLKLMTAEGYISGSGLVLRAKSLGFELKRAGDLPELELSGRSKSVRDMARRLRTEAAAALASVLWSLSLGFRPEVVVLTGGIVDAGVIDLRRAIDMYRRNLKVFAPEFVAPVRISKLGGRAGVIGAALLNQNPT